MVRSRTAPAGQEAQAEQSAEPQEAQAAATSTPNGSEAPVDLTAFNQAVTDAVAGRDPQTGTLSTEAIQSVRTAYRALDGAKPKREAKQVLADGMKKGMDALDISTARAYNVLISEAAVAGGASAKDRVPTDPTEAHVNLVTFLDLARTLPATPDGVAEDWEARSQAKYAELAPQLDTYRAWVQSEDENKGDEPQVDDLVKQAVRLQTGRKIKRSNSGGSTYAGPRRSIGDHIVEFFADKASGHFASVSEIVNFKSSVYGDDKPSAGAVLNRLFPDSGKVTVTGITPGTNEKGTRGATKN